MAKKNAQEYLNLKTTAAQKTRYRLAAAVANRNLSEWVRDVLDEAATRKLKDAPSVIRATR